jgi:hypothetical protein
LVIALAEEVLDFLGPRDFRFYRWGVTRDEEVIAVTRDFNLSVTADGVGDLFSDALGQGELGILLERSEDLLRGVARCTSVPEAKPGDSIRVHVLRCALKLGKHGESVTS